MTSQLATTQPERRDPYVQVTLDHLDPLRPVTNSTMNSRVIVGIAAIVGMAACGLLGAIANMEMVEQVNSRLPKKSQLSPVGWCLSKTLHMHREYKRLFPNGTLLVRVRVAIAFAFGRLLCGVWALGFFR